jgi:hypothetical protein
MNGLMRRNKVECKTGSWHPNPWRSRAGGGAVHSINRRHQFGYSIASSASESTLFGDVYSVAPRAMAPPLFSRPSLAP